MKLTNEYVPGVFVVAFLQTIPGTGPRPAPHTVPVPEPISWFRTRSSITVPGLSLPWTRTRTDPFTTLILFQYFLSHWFERTHLPWIVMLLCCVLSYGFIWILEVGIDYPALR